MTRLLTMVLLAAVLSGLPAPPVEAGVGDDAFAKGRELLSQGDFPKALDSFAAAARADRNNRQYLREYALLRRVVELRRQLEAENDPQRWAYIARSLHAYYVGEGLYDEALALNRRMHARLKDASSAILLAETALAVNDPAEAADVLGGLAPDQSTPTVQALLGVALARMGLGDEARQLAAELSLPDNPGPRTLYTAARLRAMTSDPEAAVGLLIRCFESTPPSILAGYKTHAQRCPDFASLASTGALAEALATASRVPESECSGGTSCAGCPMRAKCASGPRQ